MKVAFPTLEDLLNEAKDPVRVVTMVKSRSVKSSGKNRSCIPYSSFSVVVTARLTDGDIGEYEYLVGENVSYFKEMIKEIAERSVKVEEKIKKEIQKAGKAVGSGQYTKETVLGMKP